MSEGTTLGPVEIAVIGFPENKFTGEIAPAIADLVESGTVSILDLVFVTKDEEGSVTAIELSDLDEDIASPYKELDGESGGLLGDDDFEQIGDALEPNSSALAIVWENTWARTLIGAVRNAGGVLVAHDRIDSATVQAALAGAEE
jgi:uncharacterized membrane protein